MQSDTSVHVIITNEHCTIGGNLSGISHSYQQANVRLTELNRQIDELETAGICNGTEYWRELKDGRAMYANHSTGEPCPVHGKPNHGGHRIRKYIGSDTDSIRECWDQMERYEKWKRLTGGRQILRRWMARIENDAERLYQFAKRGW